MILVILPYDLCHFLFGVKSRAHFSIYYIDEEFGN
jgi:hypothetical protein